MRDHLYEVVISNSRMWLKVQASCSSLEQSEEFFKCRFNGTDHFMEGRLSVAPFRLSKRSHYIANWVSIVDRLPEGWDDDEFHIVGTPYPWCETLSDNCDCHGEKGRLDIACCSDFGLHDKTNKQASKSQNVKYQYHIQTMEKIIARRDESRKKERLQREQQSPSRGTIAVTAKPARRNGDHRGANDMLSNAINVVNQLVAQGFYCQIDGRHHSYGKQAIQKTVANITVACVQISTLGGANRELTMSQIGGIAAHWLQMHQSEECAQRSLWGNIDIPNILYRYIPKERIGKGAPDSLRATQLLALNDNMECNVTTMQGSEQEDTLAFLSLVQSKIKEHLGITVPWKELLIRSLHGDLRLFTFIQKYLNPLVGVVSLSTDILVPTMWAHYARNTGIVVGYDTKTLRALGFELRPVVYSEIAPIYQPSTGNAIRLDFVNRDYMERNLKAGRNTKGFTLLTHTKLTEFGTDWKSLSRLLLVKGMSWAYEKEVRLLVDLKQARDTGKKDNNGWPIKVIDPPPEAIKQIYRGANTQDADIERAIQVARGENKKGLFVGHVSSHDFRIQKTGGMHY